MENWTSAEHDIFNAMQKVEQLGAHVLLTDAVVLLSRAQDKVNEWAETLAAEEKSMNTASPMSVLEKPMSITAGSVFPTEEYRAVHNDRQIAYDALWLACEELDKLSSVPSRNNVSNIHDRLWRAAKQVYIDNGTVADDRVPFPSEAERIKHDELLRTLTEAGKPVPAYGSPEWLQAYQDMGGA